MPLFFVLWCLLLAVAAFGSCEKGYEEHGQVCASLAISYEEAQAYKPSTELPPRGHGEHVNAVMPDSEIDKDNALHKDIQAAKKSAGLPKDWVEK